MMKRQPIEPITKEMEDEFTDIIVKILNKDYNEVKMTSITNDETDNNLKIYFNAEKDEDSIQLKVEKDAKDKMTLWLRDKKQEAEMEEKYGIEGTVYWVYSKNII